MALIVDHAPLSKHDEGVSNMGSLIEQGCPSVVLDSHSAKLTYSECEVAVRDLRYQQLRLFAFPVSS